VGRYFVLVQKYEKSMKRKRKRFPFPFFSKGLMYIKWNVTKNEYFYTTNFHSVSKYFVYDFIVIIYLHTKSDTNRNTSYVSCSLRHT